jgi:hypothetical protein
MKRIFLFKLALAVLVLCFSTDRTAQCHGQGPIFMPAPGSPITVGKGSGEILLADLNRDGHLDMLTKHLLNQHVTVGLGDGQCNFGPAPGGPMSFGYQPGTIELGDVNSDSTLDLVVASKDDNNEYVHVFLGTGRGTFILAPGSPFTSGASIKLYKPGLHLVDVNEDGKPDLVTANGRRNSIEIFFGDGRGRFSPGPVVRLESGHDRYWSAVGDVDRDSHLDVVTVGTVGADDTPGRLLIKRGDGKGGFADVAASSQSVPPNSRLATLADLNGDRHLDIVLSQGGNHLSVLLNGGKGTFSTAPGSPYKISAEPFAVVVADVNRDRRKDLVAATVNSITILLGDSRGFVPATGSPFRAGPGAYNLTVGDINEDGKLDIAASSFEGNGVTVLLGR